MNNYNHYLEELVALQQVHDLEAAHIRANDILVELLINLGFENIVNEYEKINKWYA